MEKIGKVAIVTLYDNINIGNKLQNYAMQEILKRRFCNVETLSYMEASTMAPDMGWKGRLIAKIGFPYKIAMQKRAIIERRNKFEQFSNQYLNVLQAKSFSEFNSMTVDKYDYVVVGSDQVWHNWSHTVEELDYFFLKFVPRVKRVCIAPSFGFDSMPNDLLENYKTGLMGFSSLSCREKSGCRLIERIAKKEAALLPDPTLCLTKKEWMKISKKPIFVLPDKYILAYFIGCVSDVTRKSMEEYKQKLGLPIIDIYNIDQPQYYSTSPEEFIYLISKATYVLTNSFHASVFSILFKVDFHCFNRDDKVGSCMSDRITTLMDTFNFDNTKNYNDFTLVDQIQQKSLQRMEQYMQLVFR